MKWSWKIARIADIDVFVHATFFILIAWIGLSYWQAEGTLTAVASGIGFILTLFACVVAHEYGHALMARRYGIRTKHITLLPIGGVAMLERMPEDPKQEIAVALAGPAVNLVIAVGLWLWLSASNTLVPAELLNLTKGSFLERVMVVNIILAVFNMLPAFPMDGGRVLRAALAEASQYRLRPANCSTAFFISSIGKCSRMNFQFFCISSRERFTTIFEKSSRVSAFSSLMMK